jgi:hypothetical protein
MKGQDRVDPAAIAFGSDQAGIRGHGEPGTGRSVTLLLLLGALLINCIALAARWSGYVVDKEHGIMEFAQLFILLPTFALFWLGWRYGQDAEKTASGALAMLVAAAFVREIDVKTLGGPSWFSWLSHHGLQEILLVAMTLPILWYLARRWQHWRGLLRLLFAPAAIPLVLAGILLMLSVYFDRRLVGRSADLRFWEEFIELNGFMFLLLSAWNHWVIVRRRRVRS